MRPSFLLPVTLLAAFASLALAQRVPLPTETTPAPTPEPALRSDPGPTFTISEFDLAKHPTLIVYGDMRFHDPANTTVANPLARKLLVERIADEHPDAVQLTGDVPYKGADREDYANFQKETLPWRLAKLHVYPALGNHELAGNPALGVQNWWDTFPELRPNRRWYSVAVGKRLYLLQLDSNLPLTPDSRPSGYGLSPQLNHLSKTGRLRLHRAAPPAGGRHPDADRGRP